MSTVKSLGYHEKSHFLWYGRRYNRTFNTTNRDCTSGNAGSFCTRKESRLYFTSNSVSTAPPPEPVKRTSNRSSHFYVISYRRSLYSSYFGWITGRGTKSCRRDPKTCPSCSKKTLSPWVANRCTYDTNKNCTSTSHADTQRFQPRILPPAPRRGFTRQHWWRTRPFIPDHLRSQPPYPIENWEQITPEPTREVVSVVYEFPDFPDFPSALVWLRSQKNGKIFS